MEKQTIVTIARGFGSGGKTIGKALAKEMGVPFYDREILKLASEESGIHEKFFNLADEKIKQNLFTKLRNNIYAGNLISPEDHDFVSDDNLFNFQAKVMKELARTDSFVIIGRCADFVLRDNPAVTSVFIHASKEFCVEKAMERIGRSAQETERYIRKTDQYRGDYYKYYTGQEWNDARNYDLCLNAEKLGWDGCVTELLSYLKQREKNR